MMTRKTIALLLGLILLLVYVAPSIEAHDGLIDVSAEFYGIYQKKKTEVSLTTKQVEDLKQQLYQYEDKLSNVCTQTEAEAIFKEIIDCFYRFNLLGDVSVEEAFELVTGSDRDIQNCRRSNIFSSLKMTNDDFPENKQCLIYGNTDNTMFSSLRQLITGNVIITALLVITIIAEFKGDGIEVYLKEHPFIALALSMSLNIWGLTMIVKNYVNPFCIADFIGIGKEEESANGYLFTIGALGKKTWNESLYIDVNAFLGIKLVLDIKTDHFVYFGFASQVFEN